MKIKKMAPIVTTKDIRGLSEYYLKHFGFKVTFEHENYIGLASQDGAVELSMMTPEEGSEEVFTGGGITLCFEVESVDGEHDRLMGAELEIVQPPKDNPWGDRSLIIKDPVGLWLYLYQPIEPAPEFKASFKG